MELFRINRTTVARVDPAVEQGGDGQGPCTVRPLSIIGQSHQMLEEKSIGAAPADIQQLVAILMEGLCRTEDQPSHGI